MTNCDILQAAVGDWAAATFPARSRSSIVAHLLRETEELRGCASCGSDAERAEEAADCFLLLLDFAAHEGFSLFDAAVAKLSVCKERSWGPPDAEGVAEHVR